MFVKIALALLAVAVVILLFGTKIINWETVEVTNGESYSESAVVGIIGIGVCSLASTLITWWVHKGLGLISLGLGVSSLIYGLHIAMCKGMWFFA